MLLIFLFLTSLTISIVQFYWNRRRIYQLAQDIPGSNGLPIFGHLHKFLNIDKKDFIKTTFDVVDENSTLTKLWMGPHLLVLTEHPDTIHTIFSSSDCLNKPKLFYDSLCIPNGLLPLSGDLYPKHRKILNKAFMPAMLQKIHPLMDVISKRFVDKIAEKVGMEVNIMNYVGACALETFGKAQLDFSRDFYISDGTKVVEHAMELGLERVTKPWFHFLPKFVFRMIKLSKQLQEVQDYANKYRAEVMENYRKTMLRNDRESVRNKVIDLLMNPENEFSDVEIQDEFINFVLGSHDTTAKTSSVILLMLALHQDIQQKLIAEIDEICSKNKNFMIDVDFLKKFEYMELVFKETMRLFPAAPTIARTVGKEMEIGGYKVPKSTTVSISIIRMHRNPKYWGSDAHLFRPERFLDESLNPRAFVPFSGGKRLCIGHRYANMFIKTLLINFFRTYQVETSLKYEDLVILLGVTINIQQGCMITVKKREKLKISE